MWYQDDYADWYNATGDMDKGILVQRNMDGKVKVWESIHES